MYVLENVFRDIEDKSIVYKFDCTSVYNQSHNMHTIAMIGMS